MWLTVFYSLQFDPCPRAGEPMVSRRKPPSNRLPSLTLPCITAWWFCLRIHDISTNLSNRHTRLLPLIAQQILVPRRYHCVDSRFKGIRELRLA